MRRLAATSASKVTDFEIPEEAIQPIDGTLRENERPTPRSVPVVASGH